MWKGIGVLSILAGIAGILSSWTKMQKARQARVEEYIQFIHRSIFIMESEKLKVIDYFLNYRATEDKFLEKILHEIARRLQSNTYSTGYAAWQEVFMEEKKEWALEEDLFQNILQAGYGFFGRSRQENISILRRKLDELEALQKKSKEKDAQERKIWIPVGMLGGLMITILFL